MQDGPPALVSCVETLLNTDKSTDGDPASDPLPIMHRIKASPSTGSTWSLEVACVCLSVRRPPDAALLLTTD